MKILFAVIATLSLMLLAACGPVVSLQPLWDSAHDADEARLIGEWRVVDDEDSFEITRDELGTWGLIYRNKEGVSRYDARLVRLGDGLYVDLSPRKTTLEEASRAQAYLPIIPAHFFVRMRFAGDRLRIGLAEGEKVEELMKSNPSAYGFQKAGDNLVLTGSTEELQKLVLELSKADVWDESECVRK